MTQDTVYQLSIADLDRLLAALAADGYRCVGPVVADGAIVYADIGGTADLPRGWTDVQEAGSYRLVRRDDDALFGFNVGPHSWKKYLFPPRERLWRLERTEHALVRRDVTPAAPPFAFIGVRGCELAALAVQDRVFTGGAYADPAYAGRRDGAFIVAVECTAAGNTCFCTSMGTGPAAGDGHDIALTEVVDAERHTFVARAGTDRGRAVLDALDVAPAPAVDAAAARAAVDAAAASMGRVLDTQGLREVLLDRLESPMWDDVAARCLSCANCTLVCPTCFCSGVEDTSELDGSHAERWRHWDSCFNAGFSFLHDGEVRATTAARYRQWMTHKLGTWHDQFGTSGCVGCGRCVTWCPVGIDITAEAARLRTTEQVHEDA